MVDVTETVSAAGVGGASRSAPAMLWVLRVAATLELLALLFQAVTAGGLIGGVRSMAALHGPGAFGVHALAVVVVVAAVLYWRPARGPGWVVALAVVVLLVGFVQSMLGGSGNVVAHVPTGVSLIVLTTWLVVWSWSRRLPGAGS